MQPHAAQAVRSPFAVYCCTVITFTKSITLKPPRTRPFAARRQHMVRSGDVISHRLRRIVADKYAACILHPLQIRCRIHRQVFQRKTVRQFPRLCNRSGYKYASLLRQRRFARALLSPAALTSASTFAASSALLVINTASASGSCSACATRSAAIPAASPVSLVTPISVGPGRHIDPTFA